MDDFSTLAGCGDDARPADDVTEGSSSARAAAPLRALRPGEKAPRPVERDPLHDLAMDIADRAFEAYAATFRELAR